MEKEERKRKRLKGYINQWKKVVATIPQILLEE
jgi:hypothetical protein